MYSCKSRIRLKLADRKFTVSSKVSGSTVAFNSAADAHKNKIINAYKGLKTDIDNMMAECKKAKNMETMNSKGVTGAISEAETAANTAKKNINAMIRIFNSDYNQTSDIYNMINKDESNQRS